MRKIISKVFVILSIVFVAMSICGISIADSSLTIRQVFAINKDIWNDMFKYGVKNLISYKFIPLFYVALISIFMSSALSFQRNKKIKSCIKIFFSLAPIIYILVQHKYTWFLIIFNIYLLIYMCFDNYKDKLYIFTLIFSFLICALNIITLIIHLNLDIYTVITDEIYISWVNISKINLICLILWLGPSNILLFKEILSINKDKALSKIDTPHNG